MGQYVIRLPDIGEGVAEAELVEWNIEVGQQVREDDVLAAVMTDKATVEIPAPVSGKVLWFGPGVGEAVAVGADIIRLEVEGEGNVRSGDVTAAPVEQTPESPPVSPAADNAHPVSVKPEPELRRFVTETRATQREVSARAGKPVASPSVRRQAMEAGIDLRLVYGTGPAGRISHEDLNAYLDDPAPRPAVAGRHRNLSIEEIRVIGMRRRIAEKMSIAKSRIPHITYIEEVDVTALEDLRKKLNAERAEGAPKLTLLPFLMQAMVRAIGHQPQMNARYDDEAGIVHRHGGIHIGIATQTDNGLVVPVVHHAEALGLWESAGEIQKVSRAARDGSASREQLTGSTITITSLGALGGIATTPVINHPEVAIIGVNKMRVAPVWDGVQFIPRSMMNISASFDHRIIDGWDAALFIQRIRTLLETPAMIFIEGAP